MQIICQKCHLASRFQQITIFRRVIIAENMCFSQKLLELILTKVEILKDSLLHQRIQFKISFCYEL